MAVRRGVRVFYLASANFWQGWGACLHFHFFETMTQPLCLDGSGLPPAESHRLRAGPLEMEFTEGDLRYIRLGNREIIRRWYVAVRDRNWGTVPARLSELKIDRSADSFQVTYRAEHRQGPIHFVWHARIQGDPSGEIAFSLDGQARSSFEKNRIGFCVLHPIHECAGLPCRLEHGNGTVEHTSFPKFIAATNPFQDLVTLAYPVDSSRSAELRFEGDLFETEDQRNWIDASFKTFCTPLRLPFPVTVSAGTEIRQAVRLRLVKSATTDPTPSLLSEPTGYARRLPRIGLCGAIPSRRLDERELSLLRVLRPAHLRVDVDLASPEGLARLDCERANAEAIGAPLELAWTVSNRAEEELSAVAKFLQISRPAVCRCLIFHASEWSTTARWIELARRILGEWDSRAAIFSGTTANFREWNASPPPFDLLDGICYSVQPQEHAFDNASLIENCAAIADTVHSARRLCGSLPIAVTPVTLRKRVNPYATGPSPPTSEDQLPLTVDPRQMSLFAAGWTLGAIRYLAEAEAASATFYETVGWRGVCEASAGAPQPDLFPSRPGMAFPLFHVLADVNEIADESPQAKTSPCPNAEPLRWEGIMLTHDRGQTILIANQTATRQVSSLGNWRPGTRVRTLDQTTFDRAASDPLGFRGWRQPYDPAGGGALEVELLPYAYARIDVPR